MVTSDHGVSFRPGQYFKGFSAANLADIMSVPLLIKAPHQRRGRIDDSNIQSVDVMPTIASLLDVKLTWTPEGRAAGTGADPLVKTIRYGGARLEATVEAAVLAQKRATRSPARSRSSATRPGWRSAAASRADLIGRRVDELDVTEGPWQALVDDPDLWFSVDPAGPRVPGLLTGRVRDTRGGAVDAEVVIAVSGIVTAVTRTYRQEDAAARLVGRGGEPGAVYEGPERSPRVRASPNEERLHLAYSSRTRPGHINLASRGAQDFWAVKQSGFYPREGRPIPHRWTTGDGALVVPLDPERPARSLRIGITGVRPGGTTLTLTLNDCELFSGRVESAPWYRTFPLRACPPSALTQPYGTIVVKSPTWVGDDQRTRGVAVETVNLFDDDWPIEPDRRPRDTRVGYFRGGSTGRADRGKAGVDRRHQRRQVDMALGDGYVHLKGPPVQIALRWRQAGSPGPTHEQRMDLPHTLYPTDRVLIEAPMVPPDALRLTGPWTVTITPVANGTPIPVDRVVSVEVTPGAPVTRAIQSTTRAL